MRIQHFIRKALASVHSEQRVPGSGFAADVDSRSRQLQRARQLRLGVRVENLQFPALAQHCPRLHMMLRRSIKLIWWTLTLQLLSRCQQRRRLREQEDPAIAIPFPWTAPVTAVFEPSAVVICHLFFDDLAQEVKRYLANIPFRFDLCISTDSEAKQQRIAAEFAGWRHGPVEIRIAQNRGRDIAPKLITFADVYCKYEYVLHIHSKRSPYGGRHGGWRTYLFDTLVGSPEVVSSIFELFRRLPNVGMIAPQHYFGTPAALSTDPNYMTGSKWSERRLPVRTGTSTPDSELRRVATLDSG